MESYNSMQIAPFPSELPQQDLEVDLGRPADGTVQRED